MLEVFPFFQRQPDSLLFSDHHRHPQSAQSTDQGITVGRTQKYPLKTGLTDY
jgi:hypothetical protein